MTEPTRVPEYVAGTAQLAVAGHRLEIKMDVPTGPTRPRHLLPLFQSVTQAVVQVAVSMVESEGESISCAKGCGACCRQLVPISAIEARRIGELVDAMPDPRRAEIRARFEAARAALGAAGLLDRLRDPSTIRQTGTELGFEYFSAHIACPFLEDESCSIHADRPLTCREYLVTSRPEHCAAPSADTVRCVEIPVEVSSIIMRWEKPDPTRNPIWMPLVLALEWAEANAHDATPPRAGPELVREFFQRLSSPSSGGT